MNIYASSFVTHTKALGTMGPFKHTSDRVSFVSVCFSVCFFFLSFRLFFYTCWLLFTLLCFGRLNATRCSTNSHFALYTIAVCYNADWTIWRGFLDVWRSLDHSFSDDCNCGMRKTKPTFFSFFFLTTSIYNGIKVAAVSTVSYLPADSQWGRNRLIFYFFWSGDDGMDGWSMDWQKWTK